MIIETTASPVNPEAKAGQVRFKYQSVMTTPETIDIEIGGKLYKISTTSIPYIASYNGFQRLSGQTADKHGDIPLFDAAYRGVESGFRQYFQILGTDLPEYNKLCDTLDFLCIDTLGGRSLGIIVQDLKSGKGWYDTDYRRSEYIKGNKTLARDSSFFCTFRSFPMRPICVRRCIKRSCL